MPKVHILSHPSVNEEALRKLLEQAGCPAEEGSAPESELDAGSEGDGSSGNPETLGDPEEQEDIEICDPDVLVVVLTPELIAGDELGPALLHAADRPCRVLGVWPQGASQGVAPASFKKYGASQVPWDSGQIHEVVCRRRSIFKTPTNDVQTSANTSRNIC